MKNSWQRSRRSDEKAVGGGAMTSGLTLKTFVRASREPDRRSLRPIGRTVRSFSALSDVS